MIKSMTTDSYLQVVASSPLNYSSGMPSSGNMRYNPSTQNVEVYDGISWLTLSGYATLSLTSKATDVLEWAENKMKIEREYVQLAQQYPAVANALKHHQHATQQLESVVSLVKDY